MNISHKAINLICSFFLLSVAVLGQTPTITQKADKNPGKTASDQALLDRQREIIFQQRETALRQLENKASEPEDPDLLSSDKIDALMKERKERKKAEAMLKPPTSYREKYNSFLKDKKAELARIFTDKNCHNKVTVAVDDFKRCADAVPINGNGSFYSFRHRSSLIYDESWIDIKFAGQRFITENPSALGIIADVGEVSLEDISLQSPALKFLADYRPTTAFSELDEQISSFKSGSDSNGFNYSASASALLNHTYVLRSIAYQTKNVSGKRDDLIAVFKVVGQESDGSFIILWRELKRDKAPVLKY